MERNKLNKVFTEKFKFIVKYILLIYLHVKLRINLHKRLQK